MQEHEVIELAKHFAASKGLTWVMPARVSFRKAWFGGGGKWELFSNANYIGSSIRLVVDDSSGEILEYGHIPR